MEPKVDEALAAEHGLSADEYERLVSALGRTPTYTELGVASVMWSEHCSYKSSRRHLGTLPTTGPRVLIGPGENAGVVDIGDNQAVVFKMESHNHPSFIEPYQGAATGVGGICRDVFTMGARPIAIADCLRFGAPDHERTSYLVSGVVAGIAGYGNSFGVPTVAGDVGFDPSYNGNILVNAFCLGLAPADRIFLGTASGVGNPILYVGAKTGRDGIHGATMASAEFDAESEAKRPAVQVGDPFMEKLLLEACLELMESDALVGIQDMGAAGLTSSSVEMAARAGSGVELDLDAVPRRETGMTAYELMLSESQERMLMVVKAGREDEALAIFARWDLDAAVVGRVTDTGRVVVRFGGEICADLPAELLAEGLSYDRPQRQPADLEARHHPVEIAGDLALEPQPAAIAAEALRLLGDPGVASKSWVFSQYDHNVRHGTVMRPGQAGAGVVRVLVGEHGEGAKGVAIAAGCPSRYVALDPFEGTRLVVAEAYANLVAVGAEPLAVTNCLNFGNPEKPEIMWQLAESIRGLGAACRELDTPVISGNVSLYNETEGSAIRPTPMVAMVGLIDPLERRPPGGAFTRSGLVVAVVGDIAGELAGSLYLDRRGVLRGRLPRLDPEAHRPVFDAIRELAASGALASATDISDGGLVVALAEAATGGVGASVVLPDHGGDLEALLFGEGPARFLVSYSSDDAPEVRRVMAGRSVVLSEIGETALASAVEISVPDISGPVVLEGSAIAESWTCGFASVLGPSTD
jgi:phosphoribosylformylglycinamidine synthase